MNFLIWILIGLVAGIIAKGLTPQKEKGGYVSSIIIGLIGSVLGGLIGLDWIFGSSIIGELITAVLGAFLILWIYHRFLADKLNLPL